MVLVQKWPFIQLFFLGNVGQEMFFYDIVNEKTPFYAIKKRSSKGRKINIFPKGLAHDFGPKMAMFPTFFFRQCRPGKYLLRYSRTKRRLSRLWKQEVQKVEKLTVWKQENKKTRSSKSRKIDIFPKGLTHGFGPKIAVYRTFFFKAI